MKLHRRHSWVAAVFGFLAIASLFIGFLLSSRIDAEFHARRNENKAAGVAPHRDLVLAAQLDARRVGRWAYAAAMLCMMSSAIFGFLSQQAWLRERAQAGAPSVVSFHRAALVFLLVALLQLIAAQFHSDYYFDESARAFSRFKQGIESELQSSELFRSRAREVHRSWMAGSFSAIGVGLVFLAIMGWKVIKWKLASRETHRKA